MINEKFGGKEEKKKEKSRAYLDVTVKTGQKTFRVMPAGGKATVFLTEKPEKSKANAELLNGLRKAFGAPVFLVSGGKSRKKRIMIENVTREELEKALCSLRD